VCDSHHHPAHHRLQGDRDGLACMYVCVYMYVRVYVCMYGCICMYACICMYVCMYVTLHTECVLINHISRMREDKTLFTTQQKPAPALLDAAGVPSTAPGRCAAAGELNTKASTSATIVPFHGTGTQTHTHSFTHTHIHTQADRSGISGPAPCLGTPNLQPDSTPQL